MRKFISIVFMFVLILTHQAVAQQWWNVGPAGFSEAAVSDISIAIDGNGTLYAAYSDCSGGEAATYKAIVKKYNGSSWVDVGLPGFSASGVDDISIAIDESGTPYVAYMNADTYQANVMKFNGSNWELVGSADFSTDKAYDISFTIYGSTPYVAYSDRSIEYKATVMRYNGSSWENVGAAGFSAADIYNTSFTIAGDGKPYIAYQDGNDDKANVMKYNGSSWEIVGSAGFSPGEASDISLAIDGSGTPYVAYSDGSGSEPSYKANVMKYAEGNWANVGLAGFSAGEASYISLAIDGSGTPYVAYKDYSNGSRATVMRYNSSSWENVGSAGLSAGEVYYISIEISQNGIPVVAYLDVANPNKATVMKYSVAEADPLPVELTSFTASVTGGKVLLNWQTATEVKNYGFEIERTSPRPSPYQGEGVPIDRDGRGWEKIGFVKGNGNSNSPKSYSFEDKNSPSGTVHYRLKQIDFDGKYECSNVVEVKVAAPTQFALEQNYPNPFNPTTIIKYSIPNVETGHAPSLRLTSLKVFDVLGREVSTLVNELKSPGNYEVKLDGSNLPSGIYFYKLQSSQFTQTKKLLLMK